MIKEKQELNKTNQQQFPLRTDSIKYELLYKESVKENKSINLILNEIIAKHYGMNVQ